MAHESLYGQKVHAVFIKVGAEGVAERMAGDAPGPAEPLFVGMDMAGKIEGVDGLVRS